MVRLYTAASADYRARGGAYLLGLVQIASVGSGRAGQRALLRNPSIPILTLSHSTQSVHRAHVLRATICPVLSPFIRLRRI